MNSTISISKKSFPEDFKNFKTDCLEQDDFIIGFEDLKIIYGEKEKDDE